MNLDTKQIRTKFEQEGFVVLPPTPGVWIKDVSEIFDGNVKADKHYLRVQTENGWNEHKDIQIVSETELFGETDVPWHADWSYGPGPYDGTILQCNFDQANTPTEFVDMHTVYNDACKIFGQAQVDGLRLMSGKYSPPEELAYCFEEKSFRYLKRNPKERPIVFNHPLSDKPVMYFSPGTITNYPKAFDISKYTKLLDDNSFVHYWEPGQTVIWDNLRYHHRRRKFNGKRELLRIQFKYA